MNGLFFIRHAKTDQAGRFCGHLDPSVNARGYEQIEMLLKAVASESIDTIYSSDLQRAAITAEALAGMFNAPVVTRPDLREIGFGEWEGLCWEEIERRDPAYAQQWVNVWPNHPAPGGESFEAFQSRVLREVTHLFSLSHQRYAAVVTHAGVMRIVLRSLCGVADEQEAWERTSSYCCFFRCAREVSR